MVTSSFHKKFKLNGHSFSSNDELLLYVQDNEPLFLFLKHWFSSSEIIEVRTSGSTGKPKLIQLKKEYMKNSAIATGEFFNALEKTTALLCLPINYIAGKMMLVRALTLGWQLDVIEPSSTVKIKKQYDFMAMVPLQLRNSLSEIGNVKTLIVGGGVVANDVLVKIQNITTSVFATYGMTETITHIAVKKLNNFCKTARSSVPYYIALPNVNIYRDQRNCLVINAPKISEELVVTNDVVQLISENQFEWLGRYDNVINSGGIKLHPEKIEEKLAVIISNRFFVIGIPDTVLGEKLVLIIESERMSNETKTLQREKILKLKTLSKYEQPKAVCFIEKFVETPTQKIQRKETLKLCNL